MMTMRVFSLGFAVLAASHGMAVAQDAAAGEKVFAKCKVCHQIGEGAKNAVGPELNGVVGRKAGTVEGYNYSPANKNPVLLGTKQRSRNILRTRVQRYQTPR